mgnify:CR=1 FL=1
MNTKAANLISSDVKSSDAKLSNLTSVAPAVFVFDPVTGDAMSMNSGAADLVARFGLDKAPRLTLATVERGVMAEGKTKIEPAITDGLVDGASELRRVCRRPDGSVIALSRVWAPGSTTMLVVEDITSAEQERRRRRIWDMMVSHLAQSENVAAVLAKALRIFCLLSASPSGEVWLPEGKALMRRSMRVSAQAVGETATPSRLKSPDDSVVGRAWSGEKSIYDETHVALPIHAGDKLVAVLVLGASPSCPSDYMVFSLIESLAPLFGLALFIFRQSEELQSLRRQAGDGAAISETRVEPSRKRINPMSVVAGMRAAG